MMTSTYESFGRTNQKHRTRAALIAAACDIVRRGEVPTVEQAARDALISRSTAYRYFPSQEALVAEAMLEEEIGPDIDAVFEAARATGSVQKRLDAVVRADHALVTGHEAAFRTLLRASLAAPGDEEAAFPERPRNRLRYLTEALQPVRDQIGEERTRRLVVTIAMCTGIESTVVLEDICELANADAEAVKRWAAATLLLAILIEAGASGEAAD
jgi:AcrR family transcriptional regulator